MTVRKNATPFAVAAIDLGAHSARMLIAEVDPGLRKVRELEALEVSIPLGSDVFQLGYVGNDTIRMLCTIFRNFRKKMNEYAITNYRAIGTSAVREAANAAVLLERIRHATNIHIEIFEGSDEARLDYLAVINDVPKKYGFDTKSTLIADIGTGACQVSSYESGKLCFTETIKVGTLRVLELLPHTISSSAILQYLTPVIDKSFSELQHIASSLQSEYIIAMGSSVRTLMSIFRKTTHSRAATLPVTKTQFEDIRSLIGSMSIEDICLKYGIAQDLAEAVIPCFIILDNLFRITGAEMLLVPMTSMRHGLLQDYTNDLLHGSDYFENQMFELVKMNACKYRCFNDYTKRVVRLCETLFTTLAPLHGLSGRELKYLKVAAFLHKAGLFINNQAYHKHSWYIISHMEIPGFSLEERNIAALIARYHRKAMPRPQHLEFMAVSPESQSVVNKLAPLLRVASALALLSADPASLRVCVEPDQVLISLGDTSAYLASAALPSQDIEYFNFSYATRLVLK